MNFLFDLYGTLADIKTDEELSSLWFGFAWLLGESDSKAVKDEYHAICQKYADARAHKFVEFDLLSVFEQMLENRSADRSRAKELAREFRLLSRQKLRPFPCVKEILVGLRKRGAGVYLVSNAQACFTRDEIDELGISNLFDGILISSEAGVKKPDKAIFDKAAELFDITLNDCFYVGNDLYDDVLGAHNSGLKTVYIETEQSGKYPSEDLVEPDYTASTHQKLMELLFDLAEGKKE